MSIDNRIDIAPATPSGALLAAAIRAHAISILRTPSSSSPPPQISLNTPPGTKVQLLGRIPLRQGYLQVGPNNVKVLGGSVLKLVEKWEANRLVEMTGRVYTGQVRDVMVDLRGQAALVG